MTPFDLVNSSWISLPEATKPFQKRKKAMQKKDPQDHRFGDQLHKPQFNLLKPEEVRELLKKIANEECGPEVRNQVRDALINAHARKIYKEVLQLLAKGGAIDIEDRPTDFVDSVVKKIDGELTDVAKAMVEKNFVFSFSSVVKRRVLQKFSDKARFAEREKRDRRRTVHGETPTLVGREMEPGLELQLQEFQQVVRELVKSLDGLEQQMILAKYGLYGGPEFTIPQAARILGVSLDEARAAYKGAMKKLIDLSHQKNISRDL